VAESKENNCCVKETSEGGLTKAQKRGMIKVQKLASLAKQKQPFSFI
jgi:hypothetical protein